MPVAVVALDPVVEKQVSPLLDKIRDMSLRRGDGGLRDFCRLFHKERVGPEEFKSEMLNFGIPFSVKESDLIFAAYRDPIGYLIVPHLIAAVLNIVPAVVATVTKEVFASLAPVVLPKSKKNAVSVEAFVEGGDLKFHPKVACGLCTVDRATNEMRDALDRKYYADGFIPEVEVKAYFAAVFMAVKECLSPDAFVASTRKQYNLDAVAPYVESTRCLLPDPIGTVATFNATASVVTNALPHKAKHAEEREVIDAPSRVVGYQGHIPTAQEYFGLTFHRVEATVGPFRPVDPSVAVHPEPYIDFDHSFKRQGNKANAHNFKFA